MNYSNSQLSPMLYHKVYIDNALSQGLYR